MFDQVMVIYDAVIKFFLNMNIYESWNEISGLLAIILLLLVLRGIRKGQKKKTSMPAPDNTPDLDTTVASLPDKREESNESPVEAFSGIDEWQAPEAVPEPEEIEPNRKTPLETVTEKETVEKQTTELLPEKAADTPGFLDRLKSGLSKTRQSLSNRFDAILSANQKIDDAVLEEIEEVLITSDIGVPTTMELMQRLEKKADKFSNADAFKAELKKEMRSLVNIKQPDKISEKPYIIMVVGVNGVGKTTTIGKLAAQYTSQGKKVLLSASDTFRAAAVEQLEIWARRSGAEIVKHRDKSDPAAVAFDSVEAAIARDVDVVIVDTAGRLHTKVNLMEELKKIKRSIGKKLPSAPHDTFLVVDATTGQNAVSQAKLFNEDIDITGIILTKLDGTAKGGIVLSICNSLNVPIRFIGVGEGVNDLQAFDPELFVDALL